MPITLYGLCDLFDRYIDAADGTGYIDMIFFFAGRTLSGIAQKGIVVYCNFSQRGIRIPRITFSRTVDFQHNLSRIAVDIGSAAQTAFNDD